LIGVLGEDEMEHLDLCPVCGGEMVEKEVTKLLRGGGNTATIRVCADVCCSCGERLYTVETIKRFDEIRMKLKRQEVSDFEPTGRAFQVVG
jgi:YgiT-type zinc finger domain-containing protein